MITPGTPRRHLQDRVAGTVACTPGAPMLEVSDLVKRYGGVLALDGCSLQVPAGHLVGLLGPNGAGKTTVMRTLFGLVLPDAGTVRWRGRPVDARAWRRFGYMPEERGLYPAMRVGEQIAYFGRLSGLSTRDAAAAAGRWMARLGLAGREDSRIDRLSHGNQQRVQLAVALVHDPDLLVLDEPFAGLDPIAVDALAALMHELCDAGTGVSVALRPTSGRSAKSMWPSPSMALGSFSKPNGSRHPYPSTPSPSSPGGSPSASPERAESSFPCPAIPPGR